MSFKKIIFVITILLINTIILSGCSEKFDDYSDKTSFYLETIKWGTSIKDIQEQKSESNNIHTHLNLNGLKNEDDHMMFQNIKFKGMQGYISYNFHNNNELYLIEYALLENKGDIKYNPLELSTQEIIELSLEKEKYTKIEFELDYSKLAHYIENDKTNEIDKNQIIIMVYDDLKKTYGEPSEIKMPDKDNLEVKVKWNTTDTNILLIARQNGLAGERRDLIVRYEDISDIEYD